MNPGLLQWSLDVETGSPLRKLTLHLLSHCADGLGYACPIEEMLIARSELSSREFADSIAGLADSDLLSIYLRRRDQRYCYRLSGLTEPSITDLRALFLHDGGHCHFDPVFECIAGPDFRSENGDSRALRGLAFDWSYMRRAGGTSQRKDVLLVVANDIDRNGNCLVNMDRWARQCHLSAAQLSDELHGLFQFGLITEPPSKTCPETSFVRLDEKRFPAFVNRRVGGDR